MLFPIRFNKPNIILHITSQPFKNSNRNKFRFMLLNSKGEQAKAGSPLFVCFIHLTLQKIT